LDDVEKLLSEIENDARIMGVRFTGLLDDTANILEKQGFGVTKTFLLEKQSHGNLQRQAGALLRVLEKLEEHPNISADRKTSRLIIKSLEPLKFRKKGGEA